MFGYSLNKTSRCSKFSSVITWGLCRTSSGTRSVSRLSCGLLVIRVIRKWTVENLNSNPFVMRLCFVHVASLLLGLFALCCYETLFRKWMRGPHILLRGRSSSNWTVCCGSWNVVSELFMSFSWNSVFLKNEVSDRRGYLRAWVLCTCGFHMSSPNCPNSIRVVWML